MKTIISPDKAICECKIVFINYPSVSIYVWVLKTFSSFSTQNILCFGLKIMKTILITLFYLEAQQCILDTYIYR